MEVLTYRPERLCNLCP